MHLDLACQHTTLTPALREAVESKMAKLQGHTPQPLRLHVVLIVENETQRVEAELHGVGPPIHATASAINMYAALDKVVAILDRRLRKVKTQKLRSSRGQVPRSRKEVHSTDLGEQFP